jgi:hypothetical protein
MASRAPPKRPRRPPADFASRDLPLEILPPGTRFVRIHRSELTPLFFGTNGDNRFDDPQRVYGVCYVALTLQGAFAETCLRAIGAQFVASTFLAARSLTTIEAAAPLRLVAVHGPGLARIGTTSLVSSGAHPLAQRWSRAICDHPTAPDGLLYRANHDNGEICAALFDRCAEKLVLRESVGLFADRTRLAALLDRYNVGLG